MKLNAPAFGVTCGLSLGALICLATIVSYQKGKGMTLRALGVLPGYKVSMNGAFIGLGYGLGIGFVGGLVFAILYNVISGILGGNKG